MKIIRLKAENVKRLHAVEITPDGEVVVVSGKNGAGKSSVLDAITYALAGKGSHCRKPVREGEEKATIVCELDDLIVTRTITAEGGGSLHVESREGARFRSPQKMLDDLCGALSFDPLDFSRQKPEEQSETLRALVGLDFADQDEARAAVYAERTTVNREGKALAARLQACPPRDDEAPDEEQSAEPLLADLAEIETRNRLAQAQRDEADDAAHAAHDAKAAAAKAKEELARITLELSDARERAEALAVEAEEREAAAEMLLKEAPEKDEDPAPVRAKIAGLEDLNRRVRDNAGRALIEDELEARRKESRGLSDRIAEIDQAKADAVAAAEYPVEGLGFDEDGLLTLNGVPFEQASSAEQLRVSVAMGLALNPELRVLLVRDGSLLDEDSMALMAEMAESADAQFWIETVGDGGGSGILIEDGRVVERDGYGATGTATLGDVAPDAE